MHFFTFKNVINHHPTQKFSLSLSLSLSYPRCLKPGPPQNCLDSSDTAVSCEQCLGDGEGRDLSGCPPAVGPEGAVVVAGRSPRHVLSEVAVRCTTACEYCHGPCGRRDHLNNGGLPLDRSSGISVTTCQSPLSGPSRLQELSDYMCSQKTELLVIWFYT